MSFLLGLPHYGSKLRTSQSKIPIPGPPLKVMANPPINL
jgi:hypothetical protein